MCVRACVRAMCMCARVRKHVLARCVGCHASLCGCAWCILCARACDCELANYVCYMHTICEIEQGGALQTEALSSGRIVYHVAWLQRKRDVLMRYFFC